MSKRMTFAMYVPKSGKDEALMEIVNTHVTTLRQYGLVTDRDNYISKSSEGVIIEVFEWVSEEAKNAAHEHPAIAQIWERMTPLCEFGQMKHLREANMPFPNFTCIHE